MQLKHPKDKIPVIGALLGVLIISLFVLFFIFRSAFENVDSVDEISPDKARDVVLLFYKDGEKKGRQRKIKVDKTTPAYEQVKQICKHMAEKPIKDNLQTLWPMRLPLRSVYLRKSGLLVLDFEKSVQYNQPVGVEEEYDAIRSITSTLLETFHEMNQVKFLVSGQEVETLAGHIDISGTFKDKNRNGK